MSEKVIFNEIEKRIIITTPPVDGEIFINVKEDLYSDGKKDWVVNENLRKFIFPINSFGGNSLPGVSSLEPIFVINTDWKIKPYEANHRLIIYGNFYSYDGSDPFLDTIGNYNVHISILRSPTC